MRRRAARVDENQEAIVTALRGIGATVQSLAAVGDGCPDLLVGYDGANFLMEVKNGKRPPSRRRKTADQETWHAAWAGSVHVVESVEEALDILTGFV